MTRDSLNKQLKHGKVGKEPILEMHRLVLRPRPWGVLCFLVSSLAPVMAAPATPAPPAPAVPAPASPPIINGQLPADRPITLDEALAIAFRNHANVLVAQQDLEAARQRVAQARAGTRPNVTGSVGFTERGVFDFGDIFGPGENSNLSDDHATPDIAARQVLFDHGQTRLQVRQANAGARSAFAGVDNAYVNLGFQVTSDYVNLLRAQALLAVNDEQVRLAQQQLDLVRARIQAGTAAQSDEAPVLTQFRLAQESRIRAQNSVRVSSSLLRNSLGLPLGPAPNVVDLPAGELMVPELAASVQEAYRLRPDLRQDEESVRIAEASLELARLRRKPILSATAGLNITPTERNARGSWSVFTGISMPIWDAHVTRSREAEASANLGGASARLEQTRKDVDADVEQAVLSLASARERVEASQASVEAATVALQAANARFEVGLAISIEITDAQVNYIQARNTQITALYDYYIARAQLDRAIGRYRGGTRG